MGLPNQDTEGSTLPRRRSSLDIAIEEVYGGPQSRENFVVRPGEIRKALALPGGKKTRHQNYAIRKKLGLRNGSWYNRLGLVLDDVAPFVAELARLHGQDFKARRADWYALMFYQAAADLGDDGIPFRAAKLLLGEESELRYHNHNKGDEIFGYHPKMKPYKKLLSTTMTSLQELEPLHEQRFGR